MPEFTRLLRQSIDSEPIRDFVADLRDTPRLMQDGQDLYYEFPARGVSLLFDEARQVRAIHLYSQGRDEYAQFDDELPSDLVFADTMASVVQKLGEPTTVGGGQRSFLYSNVPTWIRYDRSDHSLHIEFKAPGQPISLVTLFAPQ